MGYYAALAPGLKKQQYVLHVLALGGELSSHDPMRTLADRP